MNICFVLNQFETEKCGTTVVMMRRAVERGHQVYVMDIGGFYFSSKAAMRLHVRKIPQSIEIGSGPAFLEAMRGGEVERVVLETNELDVLFIRNNPTEEGPERRWAQQAGIAFGRMIQRQGVLVLNDAFAMSHAFIDKLYFEELPQDIKPASIITRRREDVVKFFNAHGKHMVVKPLEGSGGQGVFLIDEHEPNLNQIIDTLLLEGYIIAQEFLPAAKKGDVRVVLLNGRVLEEDGKAAIVRRKGAAGEFRNNISVGGTAELAEMTPEIQDIVNIVAPKLIRDGLFLVGLDVVDDKLIEINVLSPGGLETFENLGLSDFTTPVIEAIERKVEFKKRYPTTPNEVLATME